VPERPGPETRDSAGDLELQEPRARARVSSTATVDGPGPSHRDALPYRDVHCGKLPAKLIHSNTFLIYALPVGPG
jgi:hypothetical protein